MELFKQKERKIKYVNCKNSDDNFIIISQLGIQKVHIYHTTETSMISWLQFKGYLLFENYRHTHLLHI